MPRTRLCARAAALCCLPVLLGAATARAHVDWTRTNDTDPDCLALYHLNETSPSPGSLISPAPGQSAGRALLVGTPVGQAMSSTTDVPEPIFAPRALRLLSSQTAESSDTLTGLAGDLSIEFWFKWEGAMTSSSVQIGLRSGARLELTRHGALPAFDRFGVAATHGDFRSAPGFTNWIDAGTEEAPLGEWIHAALAIHSTGIHHDPFLAHDVYSTGTVARLYLNGHAVGAAPHTLDLTGLQVHDASKLQIRSLGGDGILVDEVTIWKKDWSANGTVTNPFADGRGSGLSCVRNWSLYD